MAGEGREGAGAGEALEVAGVEAGAAGEILDGAEGGGLAGGDDALGGGLLEARDLAEAEADRALLAAVAVAH
ncbi:MAG: hypothetical protein V2J02_10750, partial [Pseudomonadales bacterium]|nr:hypothetical protein [Pseudomonadales bacterium]